LAQKQYEADAELLFKTQHVKLIGTLPDKQAICHVRNRKDVICYASCCNPSFV